MPLVATMASVLGGFLGYAIGYYAFDAIGEPLLRFYGVTEQYRRAAGTSMTNGAPGSSSSRGRRPSPTSW